MLSEAGFVRLVRASAWYDLIVTAGFATPWSFALVMAQLAALHARLGVPGEIPAFGPAHVLFANLLGSIVVVWALVRLKAPLPWLGRYDAVGRFLFAAWQVYAVAHGASALVLGFTVLELGFGVAQSLPYRAATR